MILKRKQKKVTAILKKNTPGRGKKFKVFSTLYIEHNSKLANVFHLPNYTICSGQFSVLEPANGRSLTCELNVLFPLVKTSIICHPLHSFPFDSPVLATLASLTLISFGEKCKMQDEINAESTLPIRISFPHSPTHLSFITETVFATHGELTVNRYKTKKFCH
jgi:hypothetical protein